MNKIKIIDLLNKIAKGEEVPEKFRFAGLVFKRQGCYIKDEDGDNIFDSLFTDFSNINDEVEILEEEKKIPEKLGKIEDNDGYINQYDVIKIGKKVDEIIDYLESKEKGDE